MKDASLIGFYCPLLLPAIVSSGRPAVFLRPDDQTARLNGKEICGKMARVLRAPLENHAAVLIMADCCNTSYGVYEYIKRAKLFSHVCYVSIPRIYDRESCGRLYAALSELTGWIKKTVPRKDKETGVRIAGVRQETETEKQWCGLSQDLLALVSAADSDEAAAEILFTHVCCPRILMPGQNKTLPRTETNGCKLRAYAVCMAEQTEKEVLLL